MAPTKAFSSKRRTRMIIAYVLAVISTIGLSLLLPGILAVLYIDLPNFVGVLVERMLVFFPAVAGVALSVGTMDKKLGNPAGLWAVAIWNVALVVAYLLVLIIAVSM